MALPTESFANRLMLSTDIIYINDASGEIYKMTWADVEAFVEANIDTISSAITFKDTVTMDSTLSVTGDTTFNSLVTVNDMIVINSSLAETPIAGAIEYDNGRFYITNVAHQRPIDRTDCVTLESVVVSGDVQGTTETTIWTCEMEANSLKAGNVLKFTGIGIASNDNSGDILTVRIYVGANETPVATLTNAARTFTDDDLHITGYATQRTIGITGSRAVHIDMKIGEDSSTVSGIAEINTTEDMTITITAQWDTADADNVLTFQQGWMTFKN